jgi:hypothetical protein
MKDKLTQSRKDAENLYYFIFAAPHLCVRFLYSPLSIR